ncbi:N-6 DNA methylase [Sodalis ligni]|nr:N-6 DNA methylase [Sodalis ligni]
MSNSVARLCAMNLLHDIGVVSCPISVTDALERKPSKKVDVVLANPPFGRKSTFSINQDKSKMMKNI